MSFASGSLFYPSELRKVNYTRSLFRNIVNELGVETTLRIPYISNWFPQGVIRKFCFGPSCNEQ